MDRSSFSFHFDDVNVAPAAPGVAQHSHTSCHLIHINDPDTSVPIADHCLKVHDVICSRCKHVVVDDRRLEANLVVVDDAVPFFTDLELTLEQFVAAAGVANEATTLQRCLFQVNRRFSTPYCLASSQIISISPPKSFRIPRAKAVVQQIP